MLPLKDGSGRGRTSCAMAGALRKSTNAALRAVRFIMLPPESGASNDRDVRAEA